MSSQYAITIDNATIWRFFKETHKEINLEEALLLLVAFLEKLQPDTAGSALNATFAVQLLDNLAKVDQRVLAQNEALQRNQFDNLAAIHAKLAETKRETIDEVKTQLTLNFAEKITPFIHQQLTTITDKTNIILHDLLPKSQEAVAQKISEAIRTLHASTAHDTTKFLEGSISKTALDESLARFDARITTTLTATETRLDNSICDVKARITSTLTASETRLDNSIRDVKGTTDTKLQALAQLTSTNQQGVATLTKGVDDLLHKMDNSSSKGRVSENLVFHTLQALYPTAQIDVVGTTKETGDIMLNRANKPKILVENKNYSITVPSPEVLKFIRDVDAQDCCGLFLAQNHGIAHKNHFELNIHGGRVILYVHEVHNDATTIKTAISIIDSFQEKLDELDPKCDMDTIPKELLETINAEYQLQLQNRLALSKTLKDNYEKCKKQVDDIQLPSLGYYLEKRYATQHAGKLMCPCGFVAKNKQAMSAHQRGCKETGESDAKKAKLNE